MDDLYSKDESEIKYILAPKGLFIALVICLAFLCLFITINRDQEKEIAQLESQMDDYKLSAELADESLQESNEKYQQLVAENIQQSVDLKSELRAAEKSLTVYSERIGIVTPNGSKYHKYGCYHLDNSDSYTFYFINNLKSMGYQPCSDCY